MTKKKTEAKTNQRADQSKILTILAITTGAVLMLGGLSIVIVKLIEANQSQPSCCSVNPDIPYRGSR